MILIFIQYRIFSEEVISKIGNPRKKIADFGAAGQIRTADLILTKDALYLLSYSSKVYAP